MERWIFAGKFRISETINTTHPNARTLRQTMSGQFIMSKNVFTGIAIVVASAVGLYFYQQQINQVLQKEPLRIIHQESARNSAPFNKALLRRIAAKANQCNVCGESNCEVHDSYANTNEPWCNTKSGHEFAEQRNTTTACCEDGECEKCQSERSVAEGSTVIRQNKDGLPSR